MSGVPPSRRRSPSALALAFAGAALALTLGAWIVHARFGAHACAAAAHVPEGTTTVIRLDVRDPALRQSVRLHVLPALSRAFVAKDPMRTLVYPGRLERLGRGTGLDFGAALQELVVAFGESRDDWVILFGGRFPTGGLVRALDEVLRDEGRAWRYRANEGELVAPGGLTIAQASDGVIILASSTDWARRAEGASGTPWRHGLEPSARASFVTGASTLRQLAGGPMATLVPELGALGLVRQVRGSLSPAEPMTLRVTVAFSGEIASAERVQELDALRRVVRGSRSLVPAASWLGAEALDGAQMVAGPERSVVFELSWRQRQLDRTIGSAVNAISACVTAAAGAG